MTYILKSGGGVQEDALLAEMFRERKRVFVDLLRWDVPVLDGRFVVDQFDGPSTIYLLISGSDGSHLGSMRLLPMNGPTILGSIFPFLCEAPVPVSPDSWEISRFCLSRALRAAERRVVRDRLVTAAVSFALQNDITSYCCVADMGWLSQILAFGWHCEPLGLPQKLPCGLTGAMRIAVSIDTPELMHAASTWHPVPLMSATQLAA